MTAQYCNKVCFFRLRVIGLLSSIALTVFGSPVVASAIYITTTEHHTKQQSLQGFLSEALNAIQENRLQDAIDLLEQVLVQAPRQNDTFSELKGLFYLVYIYYQMEEYDTSLQYAKTYLELSLITDDDEAQLDQVLLQMAYMAQSYALEGDSTKSAFVYQLIQAQNQYPLEIKYFIFIGDIYVSRENIEPAIEAYKQALEIAEQAENLSEQSRLLIRIGNAYFSIEDLENSQVYQRNALSVAQTDNNFNYEASALVNLANIQRLRGQYLDTISLLQNALEIRINPEKANNQYEEGIILGNLGNVYRDLGHYDLALEFQNKSLEITRSENSDNFQRVMVLLNNLGSTHAERGDTAQNDYAQAISYFEQSLEIANELENSRAASEALNNIGSVYHQQRQYLTAKDYYEASLIEARKINQPRLKARALADLGFVSEGLGDFDSAMEFYAESVALFAENDATVESIAVLNNRAHTWLVWGLSERENGSEDKAAEKFGEAESDLLQAIENIELVWSQFEDDRDRISFFDTQQMSYNLMQQVLLAQAEPASLGKALEMSEQGRGRAFTQFLEDKYGKSTAAISPDSLEQDSCVHMPELSADPMVGLSIETMREIACRRNVTLVEYSIIPRDDVIHLGKDRGLAGEIYIWVINPKGELKFHRQPIDAGSGLENLIRSSRETFGVTSPNKGFALDLGDGGLEYEQEKLTELYNLLIEPIANYLPPKAIKINDTAEQIIFVPHGALFMVPFPALINDDGEHLIQNYAIRTAPSIQSLQLTQKIQESRKDIDLNNLKDEELLVVGNPVMPHELSVSLNLVDLPGAKVEAEIIADEFGISPLLGSKATEKAIRQKIPHSRLIHLATHGLLEYGNPQDSGFFDLPGAIVLAEDDEHDGLLTAADLLAMNLQADLVVLSACDTGLGELSGDGVLGLARSLIAAGSSSVIVSLWDVPDAPTKELMIEFYSQLKQGKDKAQALREAMLKTMKNYPKVIDWAAFTLIGEAE